MQLINIGLRASCQTLPAIVGALFLNVHSKPLIIGLVIGLAVVIWTELAVEDRIEQYGAADP
jgi:Na+/proline symporter